MPQPLEHQRRDDRQHERGSEQRQVVQEERQDVDGLAEPVGDRRPEPDPEGRADDVRREKSLPGHPAGAGDDAVELAQDDEEPGEDDEPAAVAIKAVFHLIEVKLTSKLLIY